MMIKKYYMCLSISLLCLSYSASGNGGIRLLCRPLNDSIILRWAPTDKQTWDLGNKYGYIVERYTVLRNGQLSSVREHSKLVSSPLKPAVVEVWEHYLSDRYVAVAAQCIYDSTASLPPIGPVAVAKRYQQEQNRFSIALYSADHSVQAARLSGLYFADNMAERDAKYLYRVYIPLPDTLPPVDTAFAFTGISEYQPLPRPLELNAHWEDKKVLLSWNILFHNHIYNSYIVEKSYDGVSYTPISSNAMVQTSDEGVSVEYAYRTDSLPDNTTVCYYRIRGLNSFGETGPTGDSVVGHGKIPITFPPEITEKKIIENKEVHINWTYPEEQNDYISGFRLYRSSKPTNVKQKIYESRSSSERSYIDTSPGHTNYYVISVYDEETEKFSQALVYAGLIDSIPPEKPTGLSGLVDSSGKVILTWHPNTDSDIYGYRIYRSNHSEFDFLLVSPSVVRATEFVDSITLNTLTKYIYYRIRAIDISHNQSEFSSVLELKRPDTIPPVSPVIKSVEFVNNSLLITWINSTSTDVVRHRVYRKGPDDQTFVLLATVDRTSGSNSSYTDKSIQPGEIYSYRILAEDDSKLLSPPSLPVQKDVPGNVLPENIILKKQEHADGVTLRWTVRSKKTVLRILLYKAIGDQPFQLFASVTGDVYTDSELLPGISVRYRIKAVYSDETSSILSNEVKFKR